MRLALIGKSISHSQSPRIYQKLLASLESYDLLDYPTEASLPDLGVLAKTYSGLNLTSPYKKHYAQKVDIHDELTKKLGAINTISFLGDRPVGLNTDLKAIEELLVYYQKRFSSVQILVLGGGVMAQATHLVAKALRLEILILARQEYGDLSRIDLKQWHRNDHQMIVINACSRDFTFEGETTGEEIFWDYNYHHVPHQISLPFKVREYHDGLEMLYLQAKAAVAFWSDNKG